MSALVIKELWKKCFEELKLTLSQQDLSQWISPLQVEAKEGKLMLWAPNDFVLHGVRSGYLKYINNFFDKNESSVSVILKVGPVRNDLQNKDDLVIDKGVKVALHPVQETTLNPDFTFGSYVVGRSNQIAEAAAKQVVLNPGSAYNPFFLYGGVGLGKTHLMHAVGNRIKERDRSKVILYLHSEKFVGDMVKAIQENSISKFKNYYRSADVLLIDDIQFFAGKERTQEEFFYTFNSLLASDQQIILTSDRYPKDIEGIAERLRSRFGSGLTVAINPPELETRVVILTNKARQMGVHLKSEVAFLIAKKINSNVRELEGGLRRLIAHSKFTGKMITEDFACETLKDIFDAQEHMLSIDKIMQTTADYFKLDVKDLLGNSRKRFVARPRQMAMAISKSLTKSSYPEIGRAFGGRDHTTVVHAIKAIDRYRMEDCKVRKDYKALNRILLTSASGELQDVLHG